MGSMFSKKECETSQEEDEQLKKIQINQWDTSAVKNAIDDAAKQIAADRFKFKEVFHLMNARLAISIIAVSFALIALVYDYLHPFPKSKFVIASCSISYFVMMTIFTLFTVWKEKSIIYQGEDTETIVGLPASLEFSTNFKKHQNIFNFNIRMVNGKRSEEVDFEFPVEEYFTEDGYLLKEKFENLLAENFAKVAHVRKESNKIQ